MNSTMWRLRSLRSRATCAAVWVEVQEFGSPCQVLRRRPHVQLPAARWCYATVRPSNPAPHRPAMKRAG